VFEILIFRKEILNESMGGGFYIHFLESEEGMMNAHLALNEGWGRLSGEGV
jgi:hypothetical protein